MVLVTVCKTLYFCHEKYGKVMATIGWLCELFKH